MKTKTRLSTPKAEVKSNNTVTQTQRTPLPHSANSPVDRIMFLQRTIGNQAVQRMFNINAESKGHGAKGKERSAKSIAQGVIQAKLKIGEPNDKYEQEADRVADQVMSIPMSGGQMTEDGGRKTENDQKQMALILQRSKNKPYQNRWKETEPSLFGKAIQRQQDAEAKGDKAVQKSAKVEKPKGNKSRSSANSVAQKKSDMKQGFGFVDNRQETKTQQNQSSLTPLIVQRKISTQTIRESRNAVQLGANGFVSDFKEGDDPGKRGINGVTKYQGMYRMEGDGPWRKSPILSNDYLQAHAGHVLAKQNGGKGNENNIFAQDGGANTTGHWRKFENQMRSELDRSEEDEDVEFLMNLVGDNITKGPLDRDHTEEEEFTTSQEEFFEYD